MLEAHMSFEAAIAELERLAKERIALARNCTLSDEQITADQLKRYGVAMPQKGLEE